MTVPGSVRIREVGPRDGIQSEGGSVSTDDKVRLLDALSRTGLQLIEAVSFVSPKAVPAMADSREVWDRADKNPDVFYSALVPNRKGAEIAVDAGLGGLQVFIAATDSYNLKNVKKTTDESFTDVEAVVAIARETGLPIEGTISCAFGDPYEGDVPVSRVVEVAKRMHGVGISAISFGDTTGMGTPRRVRDLVPALQRELPDLTLKMHFHDTRGTGLANVIAALDLGIDYFDSSIGGMGGSPYAKGATGNIATEDLVHMLIDMDIETGIALDRLLEAARIAATAIGGLPSKLLAAGPRWQLAEG